MRVVGIDPSLTSTGIAIIDDGHISVRRVRTKWDGNARLRFLRDSVLDAARSRDLVLPCAVGIEGPAMGAKGAAVVQIFGLWTLLQFALWEEGLSVYVVPPSNVKKYATGNGNADKDSVLLAVDRAYPTAGVTGNDEADALTIAAMGARHYGFPIEATTPSSERLKALEKIEWPTV